MAGQLRFRAARAQRGFLLRMGGVMKRKQQAVCDYFIFHISYFLFISYFMFLFLLFSYFFLISFFMFSWLFSCSIVLLFSWSMWIVHILSLVLFLSPVLLFSWSMWIGALESPSLLLSCSIQNIIIAQNHHTNNNPYIFINLSTSLYLHLSTSFCIYNTIQYNTGTWNRFDRHGNRSVDL